MSIIKIALLLCGWLVVMDAIKPGTGRSSEVSRSGSGGIMTMSSHLREKQKRMRKSQNEKQSRYESLMLVPPSELESEEDLGPIVLATVDCFTPSSVLVRNLLYSIARFTTAKHPVRFYILHTYDRTIISHPETILCRNVQKCRQLIRYLYEEKFIDVRFAPVVNNSYIRVFRHCASSHLWFARALPHEKRVIYLNRDMIVKQDLHSLFKMFAWFPTDVVVATSFEINKHFEVRPKQVSPYRSGIRDGRGPYWFPPYGANAGMLLYDLQKMRDLHVIEDFEYIISLKMSLPLGDQDIVNYYICQQPFRFRAVSCKWNFRANPKYDSDHCLEGNISEGILHGSRKLYLEAAARSHYYLTDHPYSNYYDKYVNSTRSLVIEFLNNNAMLSNDSHWPE